jgi:NADP-dependent 3-hydroxy acid dehydrogenase YdfG
MGKTDTRQNFDTFLKPEEIAEYISFVLSFDKELVSEEIRLNRFVIE